MINETTQENNSTVKNQIKKEKDKTFKKFKSIAIHENNLINTSNKNMLINKHNFDNKIDFEKLDKLERMKILNEEDHHVKEFLHIFKDKNFNFRSHNFNFKNKNDYEDDSKIAVNKQRDDFGFSDFEYNFENFDLKDGNEILFLSLFIYFNYLILFYSFF